VNSKFVLFNVLVAILAVTIAATSGITGFQSYATSHSYSDISERIAEAPIVMIGDNVYVLWFTNVGTVNSNYEIGFMASTNNGQVFGPMTNVSNTDNHDSVNAEISSEGENVIVSY